ncbi:MAG: hypothetical protein CME66_12420 [Halobacteriovoraceae bacterium]|nr:hypothetical protein [Halobacteriovoraceae bacterium]|tara:strand:- start:5 stop:736 length:732 start_codon:yes stop_codon:yes gene_type:complete
MSLENKSLSIVIPCYNEEESLALLDSKLKPLLEKFPYEYELIFVNDGSTDNTEKIIKDLFKPKYPVVLISYKKNKNLGGAVKEGVKVAKMQYTAVIDSDCSYDPCDILKMYDYIDDYDVVSASAHHPKAKFNFNLPWYRLLLSSGVMWLYTLVTFKKLYSFTSMFRVYKTSLLKELNLEKNTFVGMTEIIIKLIKKKAKILDFPADSNYRTFGVSKMKLKNTIISHLTFLLEILLDKLRIRKL